MAVPEVIVGASSYPWRVDFTQKKLKVYRGSSIVVEIATKSIKETPLEDILQRLKDILETYLNVTPCFQVSELETKFTEWKQCLK